MLLAMKNEWNKEYNISGKEPFKVYDLAKLIVEETKSKSNIIAKEKETAQPQKVIIDNSEIEKLGYRPRVSLKEGVRKNIEFYKQCLEKGINLDF